jgi:hypothetical protein
MRRGLAAIAPVVALLACLGLAGCGGSSDAASTGTPETVANARRAIEALRYPIRLTEPTNRHGVLVGRVQGSRGEHFAFFLFVDRSAPKSMPDVPGYPGFTGEMPHGLLGGGLTDNYIFGSRELPGKGEGKRQFLEQSRIELDVEEALCRQATGEACGI